MATYPDFCRKHQESKGVKRLYWVCGTEVVLRELVVSAVKAKSGVNDLGYQSLTVEGKASEGEVWDVIDSYGLTGAKERRLIVVRNAHAMKQIDRLREWLEDPNLRSPSTPGTTLVMVSMQDQWPFDWFPETRERVLKSSTALYVRCSLPKDRREDRAAEIIQTWGDITHANAVILFRRVGGDLSKAYSAMRKAGYFPLKVEGDFLRMMSPLSPEDDVADALLAVDKARALRGLEQLTREGQGRVIGRLAAHLDLMSRLQPLASQRITARDLAYSLGVSETWVRTLLPHARNYPRKTVYRRSLLLEHVDDAWNRRAGEGVMEVLVAQW